MQLTERQRTEFEQQGYALIEDVFTDAEMDAAAAAIDRMYGNGGKSDGIIGLIEEPGLFFLFQHERLERIAQHILQADEVVHVGNASLYSAPAPAGTPWRAYREHVDIMHTTAELDATPKQMICIMMVFVGDLPEGRANTLVRPGSHRMIARYLGDHNLEPVKAHPTFIDALPPLEWPPPVPVVARRGQVMAFNTCVVHGGSTNITDEPRRMLFVNHCARGLMKQVTGNHDQRERRAVYRAMLREAFRPERRHLMMDSEM